MPRLAPGARLHARRGLDSRLGREVPAPARAAEIRAPRAREAASHITAGYGSHRNHGGPTAGVRDLRAFRHVDCPRLVALGGLTSCPLRGSRLIAISHEGTSRLQLPTTVAEQAR